MDQAIKKEYQAPQDGFFTTEMTIRVAVSSKRIPSLLEDGRTTTRAASS